ncbi:zinc ribbon domain-containing protein [uncultured Methanobrevibacter sp.]|uniref:zinc ribbon domain-containing protein n=1 Tax=uncultured Methanobrevibacter sp. TaxID=253161 RepID=UPI0025F2B16B|nr:zinc ribbon domain-containing protein [uncultured Methanobrevibacter sp.]
MFCDNCGTELADDATFCSSCGNQVKLRDNKNIYIALILTFLLTGLGSIYAGNTIKGLVLLIVRIVCVIFGIFLSIFLVFSLLVWAYSFYEAYRDVQIANGHQNPKLIRDFKSWNRNNKIIAVLIICIISILTVAACISIITADTYSPSHSETHYYSSGSGSSIGSGSSHYGGVDTSPNSIARNDPDWYYDHYEYGDNPDIDDYLESQGYD